MRSHPIQHPDFEEEILVNLLFNEEYSRSIGPFLKEEYFESRSSRMLFAEYAEYFQKYNNIPTKEALILEVEARKGLSEDDMKNVMGSINHIAKRENDPKPDHQWLKDTTLEHCQNRSIYNAVTESIGIINGDDDRPITLLPDLLSDALAVTFDEEIGHDYFEDAESRWDYYHKKENKVRFKLDWMNKITKGGLNKKTLNLLMAETGGGKTMVKCSLAADWLLLGYNVLYVTMEMASELISERIDANLMDVDLGDLGALPKDSFLKKTRKLQDKTTGILKVREFPTSSAHVGHFRHLLRDLKIKKKFVPDVILIDYINICASSRVKTSDSSYTLIKSIAEELRGLAIEANVAILTSTQTTRNGWGSSDLEMGDISESAGLAHSVDMMLGIVATEEMKQQGIMMLKQLKNRYSDVSQNVRKSFNVERSKMRLTDCEDNSFIIPGTESAKAETRVKPWEKPKKKIEGFKF